VQPFVKNLARVVRADVLSFEHPPLHCEYQIMFLRRVLLALCLCAAATATLHADQQWVEVNSPHFSVITDGGEKRGREVGVRFEQMRMAFGVIFQKVNVNTAPLEIVAFRNNKELKHYSPLYQGKPIDLAGFFLGDGGHGRTANTADRQYIALDLSDEDNWGTVFHEYAHLLINSNVSATPLWFDEGFAEYCSSLKVNKKNIELGLSRNDLLYTLSQSGWLKLVDLFRVTQDMKIYNRDDHRDLLYAQSWITVHFFMSKGMMKQVANYVRYTQEQHEAVPDAIRHAFGMEPEQLQKAIESYFRGGDAKYFVAPVPAGKDTFSFTARPLDAVELRTVLADLDFHQRDYRERGIEAFQQILTQDPENVTANRDLGYAALERNDWEKAEQYFKRAAARDSKDPDVHYLVAYGLNRKSMSTGRPPEDLATMKAELNKAISLDPNFGDAYGLLGMTLAASGEKEPAIQALNTAIKLNPRNEWNYFNLASVYMRAQDFDNALPLLQKLQASSNPQIASIAGQQIQSIAAYKESLTRWQQRSGNSGVHAGIAGDSTKDEQSEVNPATTKPVAPEKIESVLFMKGLLNSVDCSRPEGPVLTIISAGKRWRMLAPKCDHVVVMGADTLSCSWKNKRVAVNYRKTGKQEGQLVSVELE
jgi:tetratricopeptide (TPR) repeat protein